MGCLCSNPVVDPELEDMAANDQDVEPVPDVSHAFPTFNSEKPIYIPEIIDDSELGARGMNLVLEFSDKKTRENLLLAFPSSRTTQKVLEVEKLIISMSGTSSISAFLWTRNKDKPRKIGVWKTTCEAYYFQPSSGQGYVRVCPAIKSYAGLTEDGQVWTWGDKKTGGEIPETLSPRVERVVSVSSTHRSFSALTESGEVISWGTPTYGGDNSPVAGKLKAGIQMLVSTSGAFAALRGGAVLCWGLEDHGAVPPKDVAKKISQGITSICATYGAFAALSEDGTVYCWGREALGGKQKPVSNVKELVANYGAFCVLKKDNSLFCWGGKEQGGVLPKALKGGKFVSVSVYSGGKRFVAVNERGDERIWPSVA